MLHATHKNNGVQITLIDPLSQEDTEFSVQINALKNALSNQKQYHVQIIYTGYQHKDYGTCGDMCLIMLQELIEKPVNKTITSVGNEIIIDQYVDIEQINNISPIFDYDHHQLEVVGDIISLH